MTTLTPIPPNSRMAAHIARMELALGAMRAVLHTTAHASLFQVSDASRGGNGVKFSELVLTADEAGYDWQNFYHYYAIDMRGRHADDYGPNALMTSSGPQWVKVSTEDRLLWARMLPQLLKALDGQKLSISQDTSWRWDREHPRPNGRARYVPVYSMMVSLADSKTFEFTQAFAASVLGRVCRADHPLADRHLFDWQEDTLGTLLFSSYRWNERGFTATFSSKADIERARVELFADLPHVLARRAPKSACWDVVVDLTAQTPEPA